MIFKRLSCFLLALLAAFAQGAPALAWGPAGHDVVADIATADIGPDTAARIRGLLKADPELGTKDCRVRSLREASAWPDCLRATNWRWAYTFPWHFQDVPVCGAFDVKINCADGNCITAQIECNRRILADRSLPTVQRLEALAFLAHFVGDIHQPLHAAEFEHDAGGNRETVVNQKPESYVILTSGKPYMVNPAPRPPSLHWFWDKTMAERAIAAEPNFVRRYSPAERAGIATGVPADWLKESWDAARTTVYPGGFGHDPCTGPMPSEISIDEATTQAATPLAVERLRQAGLRLAKLLDETLGS